MLSPAFKRNLRGTSLHQFCWNKYFRSGGPRPFKPCILSCGHQSTRPFSTSNASPTTTNTDTPPVGEFQEKDGSSNRSPTRRSLRPLIYATTFLIIGLTIGQYIRFVILPPPLPLPGSPEDAVFLRVLQDDAEKLPLVRELRSHPDQWVEIDLHEDMDEAERRSNLSLGTMGGSRGLGMNKVFWNKTEKRMINIVFFGGALTGWPGVTHGGTIATVFEDNMRRLIKMSESTATTTIRRSPDDIIGLQRMELKYSKPTLANRFFAIRTEFEESKAEPENPARTIQATLEEVGTVAVCVAATGSCYAS